MKWNQFRLKTTTEAEDIVSSMLADLGIEGVQIEDKIPLTQSDKEQMFVDILPDIPEDDGCAYLTFYLDEDVDKQEMLLKVRQELEEMRSYLNVGECTIEESQTEDVDWVNNWKQYFHQFYIDDILVIPSWENVEAKDSDKMVIHIDPGTAFGTGMHETTQLCIRQLKKYVTEDTEILDVGCGSGILSVVALKYGAAHAFGTDLDPNAIIASHENSEQNNITPEQFEVIEGNIIDDKSVKDACGYECYDIVCANILADVLEPLSVNIHEHMKEGAYFITSGIINTKENEVVESFKKNPELENKEEVAHAVGVGAVKFYDLKTDRRNGYDFDLEAMVSFEGETGPYVQYAYARIQSILRKANFTPSTDATYSLSDPESWEIIKLLQDFSRVVKRAAENYDPSLIAKYAINLAQAFNKYYAHTRILDESPERESRLALSYSTAVVLKEALRLLGVDAPEKM